MKKQTSYVIIAFLLGIILAQYFLDKKQVARNEAEEAKKVTEQPANEVARKPTAVPPPPAMITEVTKRAKPNLTVTRGSQVETFSLPEEPKPEAKRIVELTLDEDIIAGLERNINDLSVKVSVRRESRGWRVDYLSEDNLLAGTGIRTNDLVLYSTIASGKENPATSRLVSRLENIFSTLQR